MISPGECSSLKTTVSSFGNERTRPSRNMIVEEMLASAGGGMVPAAVAVAIDSDVILRTRCFAAIQLDMSGGPMLNGVEVIWIWFWG